MKKDEYEYRFAEYEYEYGKDPAVAWGPGCLRSVHLHRPYLYCFGWTSYFFTL
ncbi:MAG: hypothetical protein K9M82_09240 [Deltaproteobacteria bacterium]|nr:hypothetical protein [Deltaproteobacteria bacterium]